MRVPGRMSLLVKKNDGTSTCVRFEPITTFGKLGIGEFATADEQLIEALKTHKKYGFEYFLKREGSVPKTDERIAPPELEHEQTVTSRNKAIDYLLQHRNATFTTTSNIEAMKQEAREKFGIVFDNWK